MFRKSVRHTVSPDWLGRPSKALLVLVFAATGLVVYWSGLKSAARSIPTRGFTSTASIHQQPGFRAEDAAEQLATPILPGPEEAEQQILSVASVYRAVRQLGRTIGPRPNGDPKVTPKRAVAPVRRKLHVSAAGTSTPGEFDISISYTHQDPEYAARLVNVLAENYSKDCRTQWTRRTRSAYEEAREASKRVHQEWLAASARLDEFYECHLAQQERVVEEAETVAPPAEEPTPEPSSMPPMIDNPQRVELSERLAELLRQQEELLVDRTPTHPEVLEMRIRISTLKGQLAMTAAKIPGKTSDPPDATIERPVTQVPMPTNSGTDQAARAHAETVREFRKWKEAVELAGRTYEEAVRVEYQAWERYRHPAEIEVQLARPIQAPPPQRPTVGLVWMALAAAVAATAGLGMISTGFGVEPALATAAQATNALPVPVVGTIPETGPANKPRSARPGQPLVRASLILGGLVLIAGCAAMLLGLLGG